MFKLASKIADYTLYHKRSSELINDLPGDDEHLQTLRRKLRIMCVSLYKLVIFSSAQLTICLHGGNAEKFHHLLKSYDWEGQMSELDEQEVRCNRVREEIFAPWNKPTKTEPKKEKPKSPAPAEKNKSKSPGQTEQKKDTKAVPTKEKKDTKAVPTKEKKEAGPAPRNPLHWAVALGVPEQVTHLVQTNAYPINALTPKKWTALHLAAQKGNTKIMKTLLTASDLNLKITNSDGQTALHIAALYNKVGMVKLLLQRDRGLLGRWDTRGRTASTMAAANGHVAVLKVLKENGQDFNDVASKEGFTALHLAAGYGHVDAVKYLLANGARKNVKLKAGKRAGLTAKEVAEQDGKHDIVALL
jgi:ankyrin repeat protein